MTSWQPYDRTYFVLLICRIIRSAGQTNFRFELNLLRYQQIFLYVECIV